MADVVLSEVRKSFGAVEVIKGVTLSIRDKELVVFVGPSGCGKSTLLRIVAGLEDVTSGEIIIGGKPVGHLPPSKRGIAMVFQSYALYPHMSVADNMGFNLKLAGMGKAAIREKVTEAATILQLEHLLDRQPRELSGGQRQRVAIGRAIVRKPEVFLFDEPLSNLDAALRGQMRIEIARLHNELDATMIYVTHDQVEAMTMADRIVVLNAGRIEQVGTPLELYHAPCNIFVAGFIGSPRMNILEVRVDDDESAVALPDGTRLALPADWAGKPAVTRLSLGVRPENIIIGAPSDDALLAEVFVVERLGASALVHARLSSGETIVVVTEGTSPLRVGDRISVRFNPASLHLFGADGRTVKYPETWAELAPTPV